MSTGHPSSKERLLSQDTVAKAKLKKASHDLPKYLFRMWHADSGGDSKLNSVLKVVPHAFRDSTGHKTVYDMTRSEFIRNTRMHLTGGRSTGSEFSSWTASLQFALEYATSHRTSAHIAMIDTKAFEKRNTIFHVPKLDEVFKSTGSASFRPYSTYHWEYLVHGVIEGPGYHAVPFKALCGAGLTHQFPRLNYYVDAWSGAGGPMHSAVVPLSSTEIKRLMAIANLYGSIFSIPFTVALICMERRSSRFWSDITPKEVDLVLEVLGGRTKIPDWSDSPSVICDDIYDPRYRDNEQMVHLMRALRSRCHGKGVKRTCRGTDELTDAFSSLDIEETGKHSRGERSSSTHSAHDSAIGD